MKKTNSTIIFILMVLVSLSKLSGGVLGCTNPSTFILNAGSPKDYPTACSSSNPSTCYPNPLSSVGLGRDAITRIIYTKAELSGIGINAGDLVGLSLYIASLNMNQIDSFEIRMLSVGGQTDARTTSTSIADTAFKKGSQACIGGWNDYDFQKDFYWDGTSNILVEFRISHPSANMTSANIIRTLNATAANFVAYKFSNTSGVKAENEVGGFTAGGLNLCKPHMKFKTCGMLSSMTNHDDIINDKIIRYHHDSQMIEIHSEKNQNGVLKIYSSSGQLLKAIRDVALISVLDLPLGFYVLHYESKTHFETMKIIKD
jgi:hypothetical protein